MAILKALHRLNENRVQGEELKSLAERVHKYAERNAYDASSKGKQRVTGDQIMKEVKAILATIEDGVSDMIREDMK